MCKCSQENCDLEVFENADKCILHCEKDDWYDDINKNWDNSKKNINLFWKEIQKDLDKKYEESFYEPEVVNEIYIYDNVVFPKFQEDVPYNKYEDNQDKLGTNFYSYSWFNVDENGYREELNMIISELNVTFKNCKFLDNVDLSRYNFKKGLMFENCTFEKGLNLKEMIFKKGTKVRIKNCPEIVNANFENTIFEDLADFYNSTFVGEINFKRTTFRDISVFTKVIFRNDIDFEYTTFEKLAQFKETIFEKKLNLENTIIKDKINFLKTKTKNNENLKSENVANRETARIIKDSFEQQNNIIEANKFYALEMKEREKELSPKKDFFEWLVFKTHGLVSNHSQDWVLVLFWIISLTFITSFIKIIDSNISQLTEKIVLSFIVTAIVFFININISNTKKIYYIICSSIYYILYAVFTKDCTLNIFSNTINPFSIMTGKEELTFGILLYKITIAYLIYQLIISIRQNTRRK